MSGTYMTRYWRVALFVPALGALAGYAIGQSALILTSGFLMIVIPYVPFAALMWWLLGRINSATIMLALAFAAPIIFLPFVVVFVAILALFGVLGMSWSDWFTDLPGLIPFILGLGYSYVVLLSAAFLIVKLVVSKRIESNSRDIAA